MHFSTRITGIINTWALTQPRPIGDAIATPCATMLLVELGLFAGMLVLAALNRWLLSPRLAAASDEDASSLNALRQSIGVETAPAVLVIAAVAVLGVLEPPNAG
ncbi:MAG TPA: CopD family protein [Caulobacterales bacterium]|nr:CopD family protein [Caulobacterales bacterium]